MLGGRALSLTLVRGDIFLTRCQTIVLGLSANGQLDASEFHRALNDRYPVFVSDYRRRARADALIPGAIWIWSEARPWICAAILRETPHGTLRLRFVESVMLKLVQAWSTERLGSLALMRFDDGIDWSAARTIVDTFVTAAALPVIVYEDYLPSIAAETKESPTPANNDRTDSA